MMMRIWCENSFISGHWKKMDVGKHPQTNYLLFLSHNLHGFCFILFSAIMLILFLNYKEKVLEGISWQPRILRIRMRSRTNCRTNHWTICQIFQWLSTVILRLIHPNYTVYWFFQLTFNKFFIFIFYSDLKYYRHTAI